MSQGLSFFEPVEITKDLNSEADINEDFKLPETVTKSREHQHKRSGEHSINCEVVEQEGPDLREGVLATDDVPAPLGLARTVNILNVHVIISISAFLLSLFVGDLS